jgi:hypothetical protein
MQVIMAEASSAPVERGAEEVAWSARDRKALLIGLIFFENDQESILQLLPGKQVRRPLAGGLGFVVADRPRITTRAAAPGCRGVS